MCLVVAYIKCKDLVDTCRYRRVCEYLYVEIQKVAAINRCTALSSPITPIVSIYIQVQASPIGNMSRQECYLRVIERNYLLLLELYITKQSNVWTAIFSYKYSSNSCELAYICLSAIC